MVLKGWGRERAERRLYICGERERNEREGSKRLGFLKGERVWCGGGDLTKLVRKTSG